MHSLGVVPETVVDCGQSTTVLDPLLFFTLGLDRPRRQNPSRAFYSTSPSSPILDQTSLPQQENVSALATKRSSLACCFAFFLFHPSPFRDRRLIESNMCSSRRLTNRLGHQTTCARPFCLALNGMALLVTLCPDPSPHVRFYPPATRPTQH